MSSSANVRAQAYAKARKAFRRMNLLVWTLLLLAAYREISGTVTLVDLGFLNLQYTEPALLASFLAITAVGTRRATFGAAEIFSGLFACIVLLSHIRGLWVVPYASIVELRATGVLCGTLLLGVLMLPSMLLNKSVETIVIKVGIGLSVIALIRFVLGPTTLLLADIPETMFNDGGRALSSQGSLIVGIAALFSASRSLAPANLAAGSKGSTWVTGFLLFSLLSTRQGTANVAIFAALIVLWAFLPRPGRTTRVTLLFIAALIAALLLPYAADLASALDSVLPEELSFDPDHRGDNLSFRQEIWAGLMEAFHTWGFESRLLGLPAGVQPVIWIPLGGGTYWELSIHSQYYGTLVFAGMLGLATYLLILATAALGCMMRAFGASGVRARYGALGLAILVALTIQGYSYELRNETILFLVWAVAASKSMYRRTAPRSSIAYSMPRPS